MVFAVIAISFNNYLKFNFKYSALLSLSIVSMTPAIIFDTLYNYFDMVIPSGG